MNKIRKASVLHFVIPICLAIVIFILWYGYPFNKFTDQNLKVYQLALTAFAATVGIGTVVNSSRSAETAVKSMELATKKESREQSSHLVVSSTLTKFGVSPPMYENEFEYSPDKMFSSFFASIENEYDAEEEEDVIEESAKGTVYALKTKRLILDNPFNELRILNIGKGSCVNLEISFEFINKEDFKDYNVSSETDKFFPQSTSLYPSYDLRVLKNKKIFHIEIIDNAVSHYLKLIKGENLQTSALEMAIFTFKNSRQISYVDFINSQDEIAYKIPNDFMILCKHYAILHYYKQLDDLRKLSSSIFHNIKHLILSPGIKPLGRLRIKYYDEEMVKENYYYDLKKKEINFDIVIKDESISLENRNLNFYLEIIPVPVKAT